MESYVKYVEPRVWELFNSDEWEITKIIRSEFGDVQIFAKRKQILVGYQFNTFSVCCSYRYAKALCFEGYKMDICDLPIYTSNFRY